MNRLRYTTAALLVLGLLSACSPGDSAPPKQKLFEQERKALEQSKTLDAAQQQQADAEKQAVEKQTQ